MLAGAAAGAAVLLPAVVPQAAEAFGTGFPGYDVNLDGRKRALERNKREMAAELERAAAYRAKLAAQKVEKAGAAAPTSPAK